MNTANRLPTLLAQDQHVKAETTLCAGAGHHWLRSSTAVRERGSGVLMQKRCATVCLTLVCPRECHE
jgi:hypothetical protein